jgi:cellobiose phosphorylase
MWYIMALLKEGFIDLAYSYYSMINPINRTLNQADINTYKIEPYVLAADIYSNPEYPGHGGWSWYTGSSSWAYKVGLEYILGFKKAGETLSFDSKLNSKLKNASIKYKYKDTEYEIKYMVSDRNFVMIDGQEELSGIVNLINDKNSHIIEVHYMEDSNEM